MIGGFFERIFQNLTEYTTVHLPRAFTGETEGIIVILSVVLLSLAIVGWVRALTRAPGPVGGHGIPQLADAARLDRLRTETRGADLILTGFEVTCLQALFENVAD